MSVYADNGDGYKDVFAFDLRSEGTFFIVGVFSSEFVGEMFQLP